MQFHKTHCQQPPCGKSMNMLKPAIRTKQHSLTWRVVHFHVHARVRCLVIVEPHIVLLRNTFHLRLAVLNCLLDVCHRGGTLCGNRNACILELSKIDLALPFVLHFVECDISIRTRELSVVEITVLTHLSEFPAVEIRVALAEKSESLLRWLPRQLFLLRVIQHAP